MDEHRVEELEVRYSHLEKLVQELSEVVWRQQRELDHFRERVKQVAERMEAEPGLVDASRNERPPHY
jgi:SlyX protein